MKRILPLLLSAAFVVACEEQPTVPLDEASVNLAISDGASDGNEEFFFFPPLADDPSGHPNFDVGAFNEFLAPLVSICHLGTDEPPDSPTEPPCENPGIPMPMGLDLAKEQYRLNWKTDDLLPDHYYRIQVFVGTEETGFLGYRDILALSGPPVASCSTLDPICQINAGSTVPIKVRIEDGAFCPLVDGERAPCQTQSFDLSGGVYFNVDDQFLLDVPQQPFSEQGTVTFQECTVDDVGGKLDLPMFGPCLETVILTPEFEGELDPNATATITFCNIDVDTLGLSAAQAANLRVHHFRDDGSVEALRRTPPCPAPSTTSLPSNPVQRFASRILSWISPRPLIATALAGGGMGGNSLSGMRSKFKIALPAKINYVDVADATRVALAGSPLTTQAIVTDLNGDAVAGATVRWNVLEDPDLVVGSVSSAACDPGTTDDLVCETGSSGIVQVSWLLATDPGVNKLTAGGRGIADPREAFNGPRGKDAVVYPLGPFDPFQPIAAGESTADTIDTATQETYETIAENTRLLFTAIGCEAGFGTPTTIDGTIESGEWDCAIQQTFPVNLSGGSTVDATLYYMNDDTTSYLAVVVPGTGRVNGLRVEWDANGNGNAFGREVGDDVWEFEPDGGAADKFVDDKCSTSSQSSCGEDDTTSDGGAMDTEAAFDNSGGETVYEMSHPLSTSQTCGPVGGKKGCSSAFPIDLQALVGETKGLFLTLRLGSGAQGNTQWPGFLEYHMITIK